MENLFKNLLYTSVGVAVQAKEKLEKTIQSLVEDEKISTQEGKRLVDEFLEASSSKKEEVEKEFGGIIERLIKTFSFAPQSEVNALRDRIASLEALIAQMDAKPAAVEAPAEEATKE